MKLTKLYALSIFAALNQLKPSVGLNLEVSINAAKDVKADMDPEFYAGNSTNRSGLEDFSPGQATLLIKSLLHVGIRGHHSHRNLD